MADDRINLVEIAHLISYLERNGWRDEYKDQHVQILGGFDDDSGQPLKITIPKDKKSRNFQILLTDALEMVSAVQKEDLSTVLDYVTGVSYDVLSLRIETPGNRHTISLNSAAQIVPNLKQLIGYAATGLKSPQPVHNGLSSAGKRMVETCQFGQTFIGSYGFTVQAPIKTSFAPSTVAYSSASIDEDEDGDDDNELVAKVEAESKIEKIPMERRALIRLVRGLKFVKEAEANKSVEPILAGFEEGLSANMCDALASMLEVDEKQNARFEYRFSWSPIIEVKDRAFSELISLPPTAATRLRSASSQMKVFEHTPETVTIIGLPSRLENREGEKENVSARDFNGVFDASDLEKRITIKILRVLDGKLPVPGLTYIGVFLASKERAEASQAWDADKLIQISGRLEKKGREWYLLNSHSFQLIHTQKDD
ncbi:MAG TPA: hypothetical protein EYN91_06665 [Candidatus Melainabacteria bacterium]|jgi:hypothetical protein|nr:MAG: hypothetical protein DKT66_28380 [Candidatus Melainabacteria bacterium]HIA51758.1 hypothetical protein [Candidatus Melainabacteria bacterium]HIN65574.1 hypothetical protein [Candidatus Obscuribacterales bacterium]